MTGITLSGTNGFVLVLGFDPLLENNLEKGGERGDDTRKETAGRI